MKAKLILAMALGCFQLWAQDSLQTDYKTRVFSFSPVASKVAKVNGMVVGLGMDYRFSGESNLKEVNGLNVEVNPIIILYLMFADPTRSDMPRKATLIHNGITLSTGSGIGGGAVAFSGLSISGLNQGYASNGISINAFYTYTTHLNGLHLSGINAAEKGNGVFIAALVNRIDAMKGIQVAAFNRSESFSGIQIGLTNRTKEQHGLQVGLWNINNKRALPLLNW